MSNETLQVKEMVESIFLFNQTAGNVGVQRTKGNKLFDLYMDLIDEESGFELIKGLTTPDEQMSEKLNLILDSTGDIFVVAVGALYSLGFTSDEVTSMIMSTSVTDTDIESKVEDVFDAKSTLKKIVSISILAKTCLIFIKEVTGDLDVINVINASNLSKFCKTEDEAIDTVRSYCESQVYYNVDYFKVNDLYVVRGYKRGIRGINSEQSKILKSINYIDAREGLSEIVARVELK